MQLKLVRRDGFLLVEVIILQLLVTLVLCACLEGIWYSQALSRQADKQRIALDAVRQQTAFLQNQPKYFWRQHTLPCTLEWQGNATALPNHLAVTTEVSVYTANELLQLSTTAVWQDASLPPLTITTLTPF